MNKVILDKYPNYEIHEDGRIFSIKSNKFLVPINNGNGYFFVNLYNKGVQTCEYIHRLVAESFIDNPNNLKYVDHINRDKSDNNLTNLRWVTAQENINNVANRPRYSQNRKGAKTYSEETKQTIRNMYINGLKVSDIERELNIPRQTISRFVKNIRQNKS